MMNQQHIWKIHLSVNPSQWGVVLSKCHMLLNQLWTTDVVRISRLTELSVSFIPSGRNESINTEENMSANALPVSRGILRFSCKEQLRQVIG